MDGWVNFNEVVAKDNLTKPFSGSVILKGIAPLTLPPPLKKSRPKNVVDFESLVYDVYRQ